MAKTERKNQILLFLLFGLIAGGCATYYQQHQQFQHYIVSNEFHKAEQWLNNNQHEKEGKNKLLYYLNHGYVEWMLRDYEESNRHFEQADKIIEDYITNYSLEALSLVTNPDVKPYRPEDFESVMLHYFTALNYIQLQDYENALVECRRINIRLNQINDKYQDHKNRYQRDAFAHNLMGMLYEAAGDYNNAFIAYRNAYETYKEDYKEYFNMSVPPQLKKDLLKTAYLTGFQDEVEHYEEQFNINFSYTPKEYGEVIFFWLNGFGPVKDEWNIHFRKIPSHRDNYVTMQSRELDVSFPIYIGDKSKKEKEAFSELRFFKVAFPRYLERKPVYQDAALFLEDQKHSFEMAQNINEIAFKTLHDRMLRELGNAILRLATKKALEALADEEDKNLGTIVNIVNTLTEQADTRNWQTLPHSIHYTRIPLKEGENVLEVKTYARQKQKVDTFRFKGKKNKIYFASKQTTSSYAPERR
ncbi:MAG: COG3014 family protein [Bacteroidales bacterium]